MLRGYTKVPYPYGTAEWRSFENFAAEHYISAINIASRAVLGFGKDWDKKQLAAFLKILDKTASPMVYLWEQWQLLPMEKRLRYATQEYKKELEQKIAEAKKLGEQLASQIGPATEGGGAE